MKNTENMVKLSEFNRNVMTLISGTTLAQALPIAIAPILTRLYSPEDFGIFAFYFSIVSIVSVIATARYELAIILPKKRDYAFQIVILSSTISLFVSLFVLLLIFFFEPKIKEVIDNKNIDGWIYWIPVSIFLTGIYQSLYYWFNREKLYKGMANSRILQSSVTASTQISSLILIKSSYLGLIFAQMVGQTFATFYLGRKFLINIQKSYKPSRVKQLALAKRYINFPKFLLFANLMNTTSLQLPIIFFNTIFTPLVAGYYMLIQRIIGAPMSIVGGAIGDVFRQQASLAFSERGECINEYKSTFKKLLLFSLLPFVIFIFIAPDLFYIFFGEKWVIAGEFAQILSPMFFFQFLSSPLSNMYLIAEKQKQDLILNFVLFASAVVPFLFVSIFSLSIENVLIVFSSLYSFIYIINLFITYNFSKGNCEKIYH